MQDMPVCRLHKTQLILLVTSSSILCDLVTFLLLTQPQLFNVWLDQQRKQQSTQPALRAKDS